MERDAGRGPLLDYHDDVGIDWVGFFKVAMTELTPISLPGKRYLVLGLGLTGQAVARWLVAQQCALVLVDTRTDLDLDALRTELAQADVQWHFGQPLSGELLQAVDAVVISPGLSPHQEPISAFIECANQLEVPVIGDVELFAQALSHLSDTHDYHPAVLAITGTNGKTTVTALTRHLLAAAGIEAVAAGNIGPPVLDALQQMLHQPQAQWPKAWVLELSSFQLHFTESLAPTAAVVLNLSQDHLDWHQSFQEYRADKARIYERAQLCIVNRDDPNTQDMVAALDASSVRTFGTSVPLLTHDVGLQSSQDMRWLVSVEPTDFEEQPKPSRRRKPQEPVPREPGRLVRLMPADALPMIGTHNTLNVLAAALLARASGCQWAPILNAATAYRGEPHRMQFVRTVRGIDFFNDSKGTNVGATIAAVTGLDRPIVLLLGGQAKGQDFSALAQTLAHKVKRVVLFGQDASVIEQALLVGNVTCELAPDMAQAVQRAFDHACSGDVILLSPACASFDMFTGYAQRGQVFTEEVAQLALSVGEVA